jgi:hypothetical protein
VDPRSNATCPAAWAAVTGGLSPRNTSALEPELRAKTLAIDCIETPIKKIGVLFFVDFNVGSNLDGFGT